jgi:drug/metabolite transporter (DMT)-like permease
MIEIHMVLEPDQKKAYAYTAVVVLFWATVASAFKITLRYADHIQLLVWSSLVSTIALFAIMTVQGSLRMLKKATCREILFSAGLGLMNPFLYYLVLFKAYSLLPAHVAQPLNQTWAVVLAVLSIIILKQPVTFRGVGAVIVSFLGVIVISTQGAVARAEFICVAGIFLALGSALIWALYWIIILRDQRNEAMKLFLNFGFGFIYSCVFAAAMGVRLAIPWQGLAGAAYVGCFEMGITFVLWLKALTMSETTAKVGSLVYVAPFLSFVIIHFTVGETIRLNAVLGLVLIVAGIMVQRYDRRVSV